jgi:hypothetical protein
MSWGRPTTRWTSLFDMPLRRYATYFLRTPASSANDFTTLLDELNEHVGVAALELELALTAI